MKVYPYDEGDVLIITHKGTEQPARIAGYVDSLDDTTPLYVNLRVSDGLRWGVRNIKIQPAQIVRADPEWYERQHEQWQANIKATADAVYARMTPEQRQKLHNETVRRVRRSPLDILIDRACGLE